jgi:cholesterol transport system auxiliary component
MRKLLILAPLLLLSACSLAPVTIAPTQAYSLHANNSFGQTTMAKNPGVLLVSNGASASSFNSTNMYYQEQPYQLQSFAKNTWVNAPSAMITSNIVENLNELGYFKAVLSTVNPGVNINYTLNTHLISLYQDFSQKPSQMVFSIQVTLISNQQHKVLGTEIFTYKVPCSENTPYGGVVAANKALAQFLNDMDRFILNATKA